MTMQAPGNLTAFAFFPLMASTRRAPAVPVRDWTPPSHVQAWVNEQADRLKLPYETVLLGLVLRFICHLNGEPCAVRASGAPGSAWMGSNCLVASLNASGQGDADDDIRRLNAILDAHPHTLEPVQQPKHAEIHVRALGLNEAETPISASADATRHAIILDIIGTSGSWHLRWHADPVALEATSIQHMAWQFETILHQLAQGADDTAALLACADLEKGKAGQTSSQAILEQNLPTLFEQFEHQVRHKPDAIFLAGQGFAVSYGAAWRVVETWAAAMRAKAQDWIAIDACADEASILSMLAAWRAGLAYIPLDTQMPVERLRPLLRDFGDKLTLATPTDNANLLSSVTRAGLDLLPLSLVPRARDAGPVPEPLVRRDNPLAYVILTSGSTGAAKSVCLSHRSLAWSTAARFEHYSAPVQRFLLLSPAYVDSAIAGIFWTIASGGELWIASAGHRQDALSIANLLIDKQPSHMLCLPSLYQAVLESLPEQLTPALSVAVVAGEAATTKVVELHESRLPGALLYNEYGPSEGCVWASVQQCRSGLPVVPIGVGVAHVDLSLREAPDRPSLIGAQGEIHLGGAAIAIGYWNRPALTAERFLPDPYAARAGLRAYRTGDYARISAGGVLTFHGRKDSQVKISGYRVELGEVKSCLEAHADVTEAHVDALAQADSLSLVAWLVLRHGRRSMQEESLRNHIGQHLPAYMRPATFVFVEQIPRMRSGKVDATALPKPTHAHRHETHSNTGPTTAMERTARSRCDRARCGFLPARRQFLACHSGNGPVSRCAQLRGDRGPSSDGKSQIAGSGACF
jgi:amino acid adenylation domain-containing protein